MAEERFDIGEVVETPGFEGAVFGGGVELVCTTAEGKAGDCVTMLREDAEGGKVGGGPNYETFVCTTSRNEFARGGGGDGEDVGGVVVVGGVLGFVLVAFCGEEFDGSAAGWWGGLFGRFTSWG